MSNTAAPTLTDSVLTLAVASERGGALRRNIHTAVAQPTVIGARQVRRIDRSIIHGPRPVAAMIADDRERWGDNVDTIGRRQRKQVMYR